LRLHYCRPVSTPLTSVFEEIVKRCASVIGTLRAFAGCLFFYHYADGIECAVVALVFGRDSGGNRLIAFEAARGIKVFALFTGVQSETALRALPDRVHEILQQRTAFRATRDRARSRHVDRARSEGIFFFRGGWLLEFSFGSGTGILVSALAILAVGQKGPPEDAPFSAFGGFGTRISLVAPVRPRWERPLIACGKK